MSTPRRLQDWAQADLRRALAGQGIRLRLPPFVVHIRSPIAVVAEGLSALYPTNECLDPADSMADFHVAVTPRWRPLRPLCVFEMDGLRPFTPLGRDEAFAFLEWGLNWCVTGHAHHWVAVHAAVLEKQGRALVLPAPPGSGKSTLCAALMLNGWRLLSDEMALLDPATGQLTASPRPVSLKNASIDIIRQRHPEAVIGPVARNTLKGTVGHLRVTPDSLARASDTARPAWLVFPRYEAGADLTLTPRGKARALVEIASHSFNHHVHGRAGFEALATLVEQSDCLDLRYSRLDEALAWARSLEAPQ